MARTLEQLLEDVYERDQSDLEKLQAEIENIHKNAQRQINKTASLTGIEPTMLLKLCVQTTWLHANLKWYDVLNVLDTFYVNKLREDSKNEGQ
jgi:hypothetical protein